MNKINHFQKSKKKKKKKKKKNLNEKFKSHFLKAQRNDFSSPREV